MKNKYWFSFSYKGVNQGVVITEASSSDEAQSNLKDKNLIPKYDDIQCWELENLDDDACLEFDRLYLPEEMIAFGYKIQNC